MLFFKGYNWLYSTVHELSNIPSSKQTGTPHLVLFIYSIYFLTMVRFFHKSLHIFFKAILSSLSANLTISTISGFVSSDFFLLCMDHLLLLLGASGNCDWILDMRITVLSGVCGFP